jgi:hypothetical protein
MTHPTINERGPLRVGPATFTAAGTIEFHRYRSGEIAIQIVGDQGEPQGVATVSLVPSGAPHPGKYGVWLKGWSENDGVPDALVRAGVVTLTGQTHRTGFCEAQHAELTARAIALLPTN